MPGFSTLNKTVRPTLGSLLGADESGNPIRFSSCMLPYVFNIKDYGAKVDGATDDTQAVQAAINAAIANGGGIIFFPCGITIINGALQHSVDGGKDYNCQIWIPQLSAGTNNYGTRPSITFLGETPAPCWVSSWADVTINTTGSVIRSTLPHSGVSGNWPSIFGGGGLNAVDDFSYIRVRFENLTILAPYSSDYGTYLSGINAKNIASCQVVNCNVSVDRTLHNSTPPSSCVGIALAKDRCDQGNLIDNSTVMGFEYGVIGSEHITVSNLMIMCCVNAFGFTSSFYGLLGNLVTIHWCNCLFKTLEAVHPGYNLSQVFIKINFLEIEESTFASQWFSGPMTYWINDPNSRIWGKVEYIYRRPSTYGTTPLKNGGLHLDWTELTNNQMVPTW